MAKEQSIIYCSRKFLNPNSTSATSSCICYHGPSYIKPEQTELFFELSDCHEKVILHKPNSQSLQAFIKKLSIVKTELSDFIDYLLCLPEDHGE